MIDYSNISKENLDKHIDKIIDIAYNLPLHQITILTGGNAMGKSVIRKIAPSAIKKALKNEGIDISENNAVASTSMEFRIKAANTFAAFTNDLPWLSTADCTLNLVDGLIKVDKSHMRYIIIDELEIGMGDEVIAATCEHINLLKDAILENSYGVLVITHSRVVANYLNYDNFINIEGMSKDDWVNREVKPANLEDFKKWANALREAIQHRQK